MLNPLLAGDCAVPIIYAYSRCQPSPGVSSISGSPGLSDIFQHPLLKASIFGSEIGMGGLGDWDLG